jgi:putative transposase
MNNLSYKLHYRRNLPHFQPDWAVIAVSFRLAFSLPKNILSDLAAAKLEYDRIAGNLHGPELKKHRRETHRMYFDDFDTFIGTFSHSHKWLMNVKAANIVAEALIFWDSKRYDLLAYCIMPNHVHMMLTPLNKEDNCPYPISEILRTIKLHSARKCNELLQRKGQFWHHESYDHVIRNEDDFYYNLHYIMENPVKANLVTRWNEWKFTYVKENICL